MRLELDLDGDVAAMYYNGVLMGTWPWSTGWNGSTTTLPLGFEGLDLWSPSGTGSVYFDAVEVRPNMIGTNYCIAVANSTGFGALMSATGNQSAAAGDLELTAALVPDQPGLFFYSAGQQQVPFCNGFLCVGGGVNQIFRLPIEMASGNTMTHQVDFGIPPASGITGGSTWFFQCWYRDPVALGVFFNLSDGLEITFL